MTNCCDDRVCVQDVVSTETTVERTCLSEKPLLDNIVVVSLDTVFYTEGRDLINRLLECESDLGRGSCVGDRTAFQC